MLSSTWCDTSASSSCNAVVTGPRRTEKRMPARTRKGSAASEAAARSGSSAKSTTETPTTITTFAPATGMKTSSICTCLASVLTRAMSSPISARSW